jgi:hypothetical protein
VNTAQPVRCIEAGSPDPRGPPCFAAFALGATSSKTCPASYALLDTADACKSAASASSKAFGGDVAYSYYPYGCYWHTITGSVYFNSNLVGAANRFAQPLCAGAALPARTPRRTLRSRLASLDVGRCGGNGAHVQPCRRYALPSAALAP